MKNYYEIMGLSENATPEEIKSTFRKLAMQYHPDRNGGSEEAASRFKEVNEAHSILSDPQKRAQYDQQRQFGQARQNFHQNQYSHRGFNQESMEDILRDIARARAGQRAYSQAYEDARNRDIVLTYMITLEEAFAGKDTELKYNIPGKGTQTMRLKVPAGVGDGMRIRYVGKGDDALKHVAPGDLYVRISISPHTHFVRMGPHILTGVRIDYLDAMLGASVDVPTIDGETLKLKVPAGIVQGQQLRAAGRGMPLPGTDGRGDMMIEIIVEAPDLTNDQRKLLEKVRAKRKA